VRVAAIARDLRFALRGLRRTPGVTALVLLTLALGIGVNAAVFSFVDAILLKPLPYPHAERIVGIWERRPSGPIEVTADTEPPVRLTSRNG
jgi:putative ABC transport system permease protein